MIVSICLNEMLRSKLPGPVITKLLDHKKFSRFNDRHFFTFFKQDIFRDSLFPFLFAIITYGIIKI